MHVVFHPAQLGELLLFRHIVVDKTQPAVERHGDGHARLGHRVHVRRDDRDIEVQPFGEPGVELRVTRENLRIERRQSHVIVRERQAAVRGEESVRWLVETGIDTIGRLLDCHVG